jgi:predicted GH43/DUF377 family glycosyl hydrolase
MKRMSTAPFVSHCWLRDLRNPVLPPGPNAFDLTACMNPFAVRQGDEYWLFYAGGDAEGRRRICLATAPISDISRWTRHGVVLELGAPGKFDENWCVLPCVHRFGEKWHLYYTAMLSPQPTAIGLAVSDDLRHWEKVSDEPVIRRGCFPEFPDHLKIAGGGPILELSQPDGRILYRMYCTLPNLLPSSPDLRRNQEKHSVVIHSYDGIEWFDRRLILSPRIDADYEDAATIALNPWPVEGGGYRAVYGAIGNRFGAYSICEARSADGLHWDRGAVGENLALAPEGNGWESQMTEYPNVIREGDHLRLFYCGNGYGATGIGTAIATPLS